MKFVILQVLKIFTSIVFATIIIAFVASFFEIKVWSSIWENAGKNMPLGIAAIVIAVVIYYLLGIMFSHKE